MASPIAKTPGPRGRELPREMRLLQQEPLAFLVEMTRRYGDFVHLPLGPFQVYLVNHPEDIRHILQDNHRNYSKNTFQYNQLATITGRGLLTSDGDYWFRQRRLTQPAFHRNRLAALTGMMTSTTARLFESWEAYAHTGEPVDVDAEMMRLTLEIVGKALFSVDLSAEAKELTQATLTALDHLIYRSRNPFSPPAFWPTGRNRRFKAALRTLNQAVYCLIRDRQSRLERGESPLPDDLLTMLLQARDPETGEGMNDGQVRDEVITVLIAGHETVASALTWTWYLLACHPAIRQRIQAELHQTLGGRLPEVDDLPRLPLTQRVFEETLRLYPPAWIITRQARQADLLPGGYPILPGSLVVISPYTAHRNPSYWDTPESFDPDRFLPDLSAGRPRFAFIPFGGGPRLCIGDSFARLEAQLILGALSQQFCLELLPGVEAKVEALVTLRPRGGLPMHVQVL